MRRNSGVTATLVDGVRRAERPDYPVEAIREAVVNALVHRDYLLSGTDIELSLYDNRLHQTGDRILSTENGDDALNPQTHNACCCELDLPA